MKQSRQKTTTIEAEKVGEDVKPYGFYNPDEKELFKPSNLDPRFDNNPKEKIRHQDQILPESDSHLNVYLLRKLRPSITAALEQSNSKDYANDHWQDQAQRIIKAHYKIRYPDRGKNILNEETVELIKEKYPLQLQMLAGVSQYLEEGKSIDQVLRLIGMK